MAKLTEEQIKDYIEDGGCHCPHCKSTNYEGDSFDHESGGVYQIITCNDCGESWIDCYALTNVADA